MDKKSSRRKFLKTVATGLIGSEVIAGAGPAAFAETDLNKGGFEVKKGYTVFNETTQKNMVKLAESLVPGCVSIGIEDKMMSFVRSSKGTASFFDAGLWNLDAISRKKFKTPFYSLKNREEIDTLIKHIRVDNRSFLESFRRVVIRFYYSDPTVWKRLSYDGPPQPRGFMDYAQAPKISKKH